MFRNEVIRARRGEWLGTVFVATPLSRWAWSILAAGLALALVGFLVFGHYTRRETVTGELVPSAGLLNVAAPSEGTVTWLRVGDGQSVKRGDALLELANYQDSASLGDTHTLIGRQLEAQRVQLQSDLRNQQQLADQQSAALREKVVLLRGQLSEIDQQMAIIRLQTRAGQDMLARMQSLQKKGYSSLLQVQQQQSTVFNGEEQYKTLARSGLDTRQQLTQTLQQLAQLPLDIAAKQSDTNRQLATVAQAVAQNEEQRAVVLRAPCDGVVTALLLKPGQMVGAGQPLLAMMPAGSSLVAQLLVPSRAIGFVGPGYRVVLRYQAFPYQKFGQYQARVTDISRSALSPVEVTALLGRPPTQNQEPLYRVQATLERQTVMAYSHPVPVKPGMTVDADILMERRTLLEWAFSPLYGMSRNLEGYSHD